MALDVELRDPGAGFDVVLENPVPVAQTEFWGMMTW